MGTNYYWFEKGSCEHCGSTLSPGVHIGKSSHGWTFALRVHDEPWVEPEEKIASLADWKERWTIPGSEIRDEYGTVMTTDEMLRKILDRHGTVYERSEDYRREFAEQNNARPGPRGLWRRGFRAGHGAIVGDGGEEPYDLCRGKFS